MRMILSFPAAPQLSKGFDPLDDPAAIVLVAVCLLIIFIGLFATASSAKGLKNPDNPARELITDFFRAQGAISPLSALSKDQLPCWLKQGTTESNVFGAMLRRGIIKKSGKRFYLDENALSELLGK